MPHAKSARLPANLRVAIIHDWLVTLRGGERVLDALCELFPQAVVHTLVRLPGIATPRIEAMRHVTSFADRLPMAQKKHRWLLPLYPKAIESFDLTEFDLVVSSSHCVAKAAVPGPGAVHVCYCHTPVRYAWDRTDDYVNGSSPILQLARPALHVAAGLLRQYDLATLDRVDRFVANSHNTASKIAQFYGRHADVVAPPVECDRFANLPAVPAREKYDLLLGGLVPYKRVDLAVEAWRLMPDRQLQIVGDGPERARLERTAPQNVHFVGRVPEEDLAKWYAGARLFAFPGEEDFGIVPLEAQSAGVPVVALGKGGALETVVDGQTGVFFYDSTPQALVAAVQQLDQLAVDPDTCRKHARGFDRRAFLDQMAAIVADALDAQRNGSLRTHEVA
jgi:glycosyltransferase involved in cell wall biosynthesis